MGIDLPLQTVSKDLKPDRPDMPSWYVRAIYRPWSVIVSTSVNMLAGASDCWSNRNAPPKPFFHSIINIHSAVVV